MGLGLDNAGNAMQILQDAYVQSYGSRRGEGDVGGAGYIGIICGKIVKYNTHRCERKTETAEMCRSAETLRYSLAAAAYEVLGKDHDQLRQILRILGVEAKNDEWSLTPGGTRQLLRRDVAEVIRLIDVVLDDRSKVRTHDLRQKAQRLGSKDVDTRFAVLSAKNNVKSYNLDDVYHQFKKCVAETDQEMSFSLPVSENDDLAKLTTRWTPSLVSRSEECKEGNLRARMLFIKAIQNRLDGLGYRSPRDYPSALTEALKYEDFGFDVHDSVTKDRPLTVKRVRKVLEVIEGLALQTPNGLLETVNERRTALLAQTGNNDQLFHFEEQGIMPFFSDVANSIQKENNDLPSDFINSTLLDTSKFIAMVKLAHEAVNQLLERFRSPVHQGSEAYKAGYNVIHSVEVQEKITAVSRAGNYEALKKELTELKGLLWHKQKNGMDNIMLDPSLIDAGISHIECLVSDLKSVGHSTGDMMEEFNMKCRKNGIDPVVGKKVLMRSPEVFEEVLNERYYFVGSDFLRASNLADRADCKLKVRTPCSIVGV